MSLACKHTDPAACSPFFRPNRVPFWLHRNSLPSAAFSGGEPVPTSPENAPAVALLTVLRDGEMLELRVASEDRSRYLKKPRLH